MTINNNYESTISGNKNVGAYKKINQNASDDDIESSEEYTVFDKTDKSTVQLQLIPSLAEKRRRPREDFDVKGKANSCHICLLVIAIVVVAMAGLAIGIVLVRTLQSPPEMRINSDTSDTNTYATTPTLDDTGNTVPNTGSIIKWKRTLDDASSESCVRLVDIDGDGKDDIIFAAGDGLNMDGVMEYKSDKYIDAENFCHSIGRVFPCMGHIIGVRGYDGHTLWNLTVRSEVFLMNCEVDINRDGKPDCIGTGRQGTAVAFNPYTGSNYWSVDDDRFFKPNWNIYQCVAMPDWDASVSIDLGFVSGTRYWSVDDDRFFKPKWNIYQCVAIPDWDGDGVPEILLANGGNPDKDPDDHDRESGRLVVVSGISGRPLGENYLEMPNSRETYMTPVLYHPPKGSSVILFGSGGETISGDLMGITITDLCRYIYGYNKAAAVCPEKEAETIWPHLPRDEKGLFVIIRGEKKGVMVPPVIIDMDGDSIDDLLISVYEGLLVLKNGKDLTDMWTVSFPNMESYCSPAPGHFDGDDILDFMVHNSVGAWPHYSSSNVSVISGKDGTILWTLESASFEMKSDLVLRTKEPQRDVFLFKQKGLGSPYRTNDKGQLIRPGNVKRQKRHGEEKSNSHKVHIPANVSPDMILAALKKDHEKYHLTCDDDLTRHRGEIFLVDRTTVQTPLKILDIPIYKFWYDPVEDTHGMDDKAPSSHMGVRAVSGSHSDTAKAAGDKEANRSERMCALMDSDDRSTGAVGDVDGDGILDYVSIYGSTGVMLTQGYSYGSEKYKTVVTVVSLNLRSEEIKPMPVSSESSFRMEENLKDIRRLQMLPSSEQKWTQYMGKYGDNTYEH